MATMIIAGEKLTMPVWLKARLLEVLTTDDIAVLSVESGSERGKFYPVRHDGRVALPCPCRATIDKCAHMLAAERYLASVEVLGAEIAQDLNEHVEDDLTSHEEEYGELAEQAEAIVTSEQAERESVRASIELRRQIDEERERDLQRMEEGVRQEMRKCSMTVERKVERTPFGTMVLMR